MAPHGTRTEWVYDDAQRLDKIVRRASAGGGSAVMLELDYTLTADGLVSQIDQKDATHLYSVFFDYDKRGRLIREHGTIWSGDGGPVGQGCAIVPGNAADSRLEPARARDRPAEARP